MSAPDRTGLGQTSLSLLDLSRPLFFFLSFFRSLSLPRFPFSLPSFSQKKKKKKKKNRKTNRDKMAATTAPRKHDVPALLALGIAALGGVVALGAVAHQQRSGTLFAPAVPPTWWAVALQLVGVAVATVITANPRLPRAPAVAALAFASYPLSNRAQDAILGGAPTTATTAAGVGFILAAIGDYLAIMALGTKKQRDGGVGFVLTWRWFLALLSTLLAGGGLLIAMGASTAMAVRNKTVTFLLWVSRYYLCFFEGRERREEKTKKASKTVGEEKNSLLSRTLLAPPPDKKPPNFFETKNRTCSFRAPPSCPPSARSCLQNGSEATAASSPRSASWRPRRSRCSAMRSRRTSTTPSVL